MKVIVLCGIFFIFAKDGSADKGDAFCPLKCGLCQECKQWCSPNDWCGDSYAHKGGKYLKHMATDCRDCENVGPPSYVESKGACRGGTSPGGNAGLVYHQDRDCRHRCDIDSSCTGYVMPNSYVEWYGFAKKWLAPNWCETYTSPGVTGDGSSGYNDNGWKWQSYNGLNYKVYNIKHGYKCHAKIPHEKNDAYISNIEDGGKAEDNLDKGSDSECYSSNSMYHPIDNVDQQVRTSELNATACQNRCSNVKGCSYFSFWANGGCHLSNSSSTKKTQDGVTSGPKTC